MDGLGPSSEKPLGTVLPETLPVPPDGREAKSVPSAESQLAPGTRVGQFVIERVVGRGGMGVVYAATDVDLHRRVAIKFLLPLSGRHQATTTERLVREAQAIAALSHPNVVNAYVVDTDAGRPYMAMEYVDGGTLRQWLGAHRRTWRQIVEVFVEAGRGLAAAHAAGLVHRDFKPDNVLMDHERVRVADFGLAGMANSASARAHTEPTGTLAFGTPKYMAPEYRNDCEFDARSDQYSFCVSLQEALALTEESGRPRPRGGSVPRRVRRVVERGTRDAPAERFRDMPALITELENALSIARRRWLVGAVVAVMAGVGAAWLAIPDSPSLCARADDQLLGVWDQDKRTAIRRAFNRSGRTHAGDSFHRVATRLDAYATEWLAAHTAACEATHVHATQTAALLDRRMHCLDRRLSALAALTTVLEQAGPEVVDESITAVDSLAPLSVCADLERLSQAMPPPEDPAKRSAAAALRKQIDHADALEKAGQYDEGLAAALALQSQITATQHWPLSSYWLVTVGRLQNNSGDAKAAEATLRRAVHAAAKAKDDVTTARAWLLLIHAIGFEQGRIADALALRGSVEAAAARTGDHPGVIQGMGYTFGVLLLENGAYAEARQQLERALAVFGEPDRDDGPTVRTLEVLAAVSQSTGDLERANREYRDVVVRAERVFGSNHPAFAAFADNFGTLLADQGRYAEALEQHQRALAILGGANAVPRRDVAVTLHNIARVYSGLGQIVRARDYGRRALDIKMKVLGREHISVAATLNNLGVFEQQSGRDNQARDYFERALKIRQRMLAPGHPDIALTLRNLAEVAIDDDSRRAYLKQARDAGKP